MADIPAVFEKQLLRLQAHPTYLHFSLMPTGQRLRTLALWSVLALTFLFGGLWFAFGETVVLGFLASIAAGLATGIGALPALFVRSVSRNVFNVMLGLAAGVMLAATAFSLIVPGISYGDLVWPGKGLWVVCVGMLLGALFLHVADRRLPHLHFDETEEAVSNDTQKNLSLFILAITIHNFPEGMSVGVSFGSGDWGNGLVLSMAIAFQNMPEGLAVALPLVGLGYNKWRAVAIATLTGLVEPLGGLLGVTMVTEFASILPVAMGFAAGAMLFVISEEIIPQTHTPDRSRLATFSLMVGFIVMLVLEKLLG
jgi:zinc transporter, ZIP family